MGDSYFKIQSLKIGINRQPHFQSMSDQEIAELYHVSRSAIYRRRSNGLKKLKTVLKERNRTNEKRIRLPYIKNNMSSVGNETAIREILKFYDAYICKLCLRPFYHSESGKITMQVDEELKGQIHTEMMKAILKFEIRVK